MVASVRARAATPVPARPATDDEYSIPCEACGQWVPVGGYERTPNGYPRSVCRACRNERKRLLYQSDPQRREQRNAYARTYYAEHADYCRARRRRYVEANRQQIRDTDRERSRRRRARAADDSNG